jgi:NADH:ubiquinone oxidoreductase subunit E
MPSPTRSPTHEDVPPATLAKLGLDLDEALEEAGADALPHDKLVELAGDRGKPVSQYYAASVLATDVAVAPAHDVTLVFCAGVCQRWGALDCIDRAAERLEERTAKGQRGFDIAVRTCLDKCEHAPVCEIRTPDGTSVITQASPAKIDTALAELG